MSARRKKQSGADIEWYLISVDRLKQLIVLLVLALLGAAGFLYYRSLQTPDQKAQKAIEAAEASLNETLPRLLAGLYGVIQRIGANNLRFGQTNATTTSRGEINKAVASIADNTATATFTVTVPNAAHSAMLKVTLVGSLGAGGAVGANEATGTISYDFSIARTAGVATVVTASTAYGSATSSVAGAATITITAAASAMTGANSATQTFTINVTIARGSGASTNHTCLCYGRLLNSNASGVTIA